MVMKRLLGLALTGCLWGTGAWAMANNVQVLLEGSLVKIQGDNLANQITVNQGLTGDIVVIGRNGTLVNGQPSVRLRRVNLEQMEIRMEGGNDVVTVNGLNVLNDLYVNLGAGVDRFMSGSVPSTVGANLAIEGDAGNEMIRLVDWAIGGDCFIDGQVGSLNAELRGLDVGFGLTVIGDFFNDTVVVDNCVVGATTSIETKDGADRITVTNFAGFDLFVNSDMGNDTVILEAVSTLEDIGIFTGTQNDTVTMFGVDSAKNIIVSLDGGTDAFSGTNVSAAFDAVFEGGAGVDTFGDFGVAGGVKTEIKEFEIFP